MKTYGYFPLILSGLISLFLAFFVVYPTVMSYSPKAAEIDQLREEVRILKQKDQTLKNLNLEDLTVMVQKADVALPTEKSFPGLLSGLEALAKEAGSTLLTFDSSPGVISKSKKGLTPEAAAAVAAESEGEKKVGIKYLEAEIGINSNAASLIDLSATLIKSSRLVTLENVTFENSDKVSVDKTNTKIKLRVYFQPEGATPAAQIQFNEISQDEKDVIAKVDALNRFTLELPNFLPSREDPFSPSSRVVPPPATSSSSVQP